MQQNVSTHSTQRHQRVNSCSRPWNCQQRVAWGLGVLLPGFVYSLVLPNLSEPAKTTAICVYCVAVLTAFVTWLFCALLDPSDPGVQNARDPAKYPLQLSKQTFPNFCRLCQARVRLKSIHCRRCGRCAAAFDHHCQWLNTCIAQRNYAWFVALVSAVEAVLAVQVYCGVALTVQIAGEGMSRSDVLRKYDMGDNGYTYFAVLAWALAVSVAGVVVIGYLLLFHVYLISKKLTTYEWIVSRRAAYVTPSKSVGQNAESFCQMSHQATAAPRIPSILPAGSREDAHSAVILPVDVSS